MLECDLNAVVEKLLILVPELISAPGAAVEKLRHSSHWGVWLALDLRHAAHVGQAVEIIVDHILKGLVWHDAGYGLDADSEHLRTCANRRDMLKAPSLFVIEAQAGGSGAVGFSGNGIFAAAIRLMTARTCSRSAALTGASANPPRRAPAATTCLNL
jgi:hypothetical protein